MKNRASRNYDTDYISEDGKKRLGVEIIDKDDEVVDYEYFDTEKEANEFIKQTNK
jgi:hypothetical protein